VAIPEAVTVSNIVTSPASPVAHLAVVFAPCMNCPIANGDLGSTTSLALEIGGLVHVAVNTTTNAGDGVSGSKTVRAMVHHQSLVLEGLLQSPDALGDLASLGMVSVEVLDFTLQRGVIFSL